MNTEDELNKSTSGNDCGVLIISGVARASVPVLVELERWLESRHIPLQIVELDRMSRVRFVVKSAIAVFKKRRQPVIFANPQSLVVLRILQSLPLRIHRAFYWAFESNSTAPVLSPVWAGIYAEKLIRRNEVDLIIPLEERRDGLSKGYRSVKVFENLAAAGREFISRKLSPEQRIELVLFGSLRPSHTYAIEFISLVAANPDLFKLTLIGDDRVLQGVNITTDNVTILGRMSHGKLISTLTKQFHYSIVGYKPVSFNYRFCAPNKLFESYSLSLPVLANSENPTLSRLTGACGVVSDFSSLDAVELHDRLRIGYSRKQKSAFSAYKNYYNFDARAEEVFSFLRASRYG